MATEKVIYRDTQCGSNNLTTLVVISMSSHITVDGAYVYIYKYQRVMYPVNNESLTKKRTSRSYSFTSSRNDLTKKEMLDKFTEAKSNNVHVIRKRLNNL